MQAQSVNVFGGHQFLEYDSSTSLISEVVSAPVPLVGNTVKLALLVYNLAGTNSPDITAGLEGSVLGQSWEPISDGGVSLATWGAVTSATDATISHAMIRVRVTVSSSANGDCKAWFTVGLAITQQ